MSFLTELFSSSVGEVVEKVGNVIDDLHTSQEEKLKLKAEMLKLEADAKLKAVELENKYQEEISKRWESDNLNGSWLSKNVRPASLVYLLGVLTIMAFSDGNIGEFTIDSGYIDLFKGLAITAFGGYFAMRSFDKFNIKKK